MVGCLGGTQNASFAGRHLSSCPQSSLVIVRQLQCTKQSLKRVAIRVCDSALELLDTLLAQPSPLGECSLCQPSRKPMLAKQVAEAQGCSHRRWAFTNGQRVTQPHSTTGDGRMRAHIQGSWLGAWL
jgi:hypothetical protein